MTCRDLITDALQEIKTYAAGETPSAEDMTLGLQRLQKVSDTYLGDDSSTLTLDDDVPGPDEEAFLYELAFRLCGPFGYSFTDEQVVNRRRAKSRLLALLDTPADAEVETGLMRLSGWRWQNINFDTGTD